LNTVAIALLLFIGCEASAHASVPAAETIMFCRNYSTLERAIGQIVTTNVLDTNVTIRVQLRGSVLSPGGIEVPKGATVLQAIKRAGGFGEARVKTVKVLRNKEWITLSLHEDLIESKTPYAEFRIWFGKSPGWVNQGGEAGSGAAGDFPLEAGDFIVALVSTLAR